MLDYLWAAMILIGIIVAAFLGNLDMVGEGMIASAKEGIELLFLMTGVVGMWNGFLYIAERSGLTKVLVRFLKPVLSLAFPDLPKEHEATEHIAENFIANFLGLGWACTPTGLRGMKALKQLQKERGLDDSIASNEMCTFLLLNISSLQLIPMNMIAYRSQYGSVNPIAVVGPSLLATTITTVVTFFICRALCNRKKVSKGGKPF